MNKKGFTLLEVMISISLVSIILVSLFSTLVKMRENYDSVYKNSNIELIKSSVTRIISKDINDGSGIKNDTLKCESFSKCNFTLVNGEKRKVVIDSFDIGNINYRTLKYLNVNDSIEKTLYLRTLKSDKNSSERQFSFGYMSGEDISIGESNYLSKLVIRINDDYSKKESTYDIIISSAASKTIKVTVSYDATGGSVNPESNIQIYGKEYENLPDSFRSGYNFEGWYTASSGGEHITESSIVKRKENHTLFANWNGVNVTITYNPNGGSVSPTTQTKVYGGNYLSLPTPTRNGYTFDGWYTENIGGSKVLTTTPIIDYQPHTLYAHWIANSVKVTYNANGGNVSPASENKIFDSTYGTLPTPTRNGYTFDGWYTASSGGTQVTTATTVTNYSNHTLYAHWNGVNVTITYNPNGGSVSPTTQTKVYGGNYLSLPTPTRNGYTFDGWYTENIGGSKVLTTTPIIDYQPHTLYAHWTANSVKVTYNANGGTVSPASENKIFDSTYGTLPTPTMTNYIFDGWYTASSDGTKVTSSTKVTNYNDHTLYAHWKINSTFSFNYSGKFKTSSSGAEMTGDYEPTSENFYIWFLTSGNLTVKQISTNVDIFLVAGGAAGGYNNCCGGISHTLVEACCGGPGGERITKLNQTLNVQKYSVVIGSSDTNSTAFGFTARTGYGSAGGNKGRASGDYNGSGCYWQENAIKGTNGKYAFNDSTVDGIIYGSGGGGGYGGGNFGGVTCAGQGANGGTNAGNGGKARYGSGTSGKKNTGAGGGGAAMWRIDPYTFNGYQSGDANNGSGGSGILIIRNAR